MITFNAEGVELPALPEAQTVRWLTQVARRWGRTVGQINYVFVGDDEILHLNRQFLGHDYFTDHIGFDYGTQSIASGDIYISLDTVRTNAPLYGSTFQEELLRVVAHGLLHLCGLDDHTPEEQQRMRQAEDEALAPPLSPPSKSP